MQSEQWKLVVGFESYYQVSSYGRVRRIRRGKGTRPGHVLKTPPDSCGYPRVRLSVEGKATDVNVHILVAAAFIGPCPDDQEVNHKNLNRSDNAEGNLEYLPHAKTIQHSYAHRRAAA